MRRLLEHEVDFAREQATLLTTAEIYRTIPGVRTPQLIAPLCAAQVTAMSEERGIKITEAAAKLPSWQRQHIAARLIEALIGTPLFAPERSTIFHADPHAGNLLYDRASDCIVILDWALTGTLADSQRRQLALLLIMFALRDPAGMYSAIAALAEPAGDAEQQRLIRHCVNESLGEVPWTALPGLMDLTRLLDRLALQGVAFPSSLLMFRKVLFTLDGVLHQIAGPQFSTDFALARFLAGRWLLQGPAAALPLYVNDWLAVQWSALNYGTRLWSLAARL